MNTLRPSSNCGQADSPEIRTASYVSFKDVCVRAEAGFKKPHLPIWMGGGRRGDAQSVAGPIRIGVVSRGLTKAGGTFPRSSTSSSPSRPTTGRPFEVLYGLGSGAKSARGTRRPSTTPTQRPRHERRRRINRPARLVRPSWGVTMTRGGRSRGQGRPMPTSTTHSGVIGGGGRNQAKGFIAVLQPKKKKREALCWLAFIS